MQINELHLDALLHRLQKLSADTPPEWGTMNAQQMVEHISETTHLSVHDEGLELQIPEDKIDRMQAFLLSEKPMKRGIKVSFVPNNAPLKHNSMEEAIDNFVSKFQEFEKRFTTHPNQRTLHPYYGKLNYNLWKHLHAKHYEHHFTQFGV